jgi:hypothetical protein
MSRLWYSEDYISFGVLLGVPDWYQRLSSHLETAENYDQRHMPHAARLQLPTDSDSNQDGMRVAECPAPSSCDQICNMSCMSDFKLLLG